MAADPAEEVHNKQDKMNETALNGFMAGTNQAWQRLCQVSQPLHWALLHQSLLGLRPTVDNLLLHFIHLTIHRALGHPIFHGLVQAHNLVYGVLP